MTPLDYIGMFLLWIIGTILIALSVNRMVYIKEFPKNHPHKKIELAVWSVTLMIGAALAYFGLVMLLRSLG